MSKKKTLQIIIPVWLLLAGCSPYTQQIKKLDVAYASGHVDAKTYWMVRQGLMQEDMQWRQTVAANAAAMSAGMARAASPPAVYAAPPPVQPTTINVGGFQPIGYAPFYR